MIGIGGNLNLQNKMGRTVLIAAVQYGHAGTAKLLLDRKADINLGDTKVYSPAPPALQFKTNLFCRAAPLFALQLNMATLEP